MTTYLENKRAFLKTEKYVKINLSLLRRRRFQNKIHHSKKTMKQALVTIYIFIHLQALVVRCQTIRNVTNSDESETNEISVQDEAVEESSDSLQREFGRKLTLRKLKDQKATTANEINRKFTQFVRESPFHRSVTRTFEVVNAPAEFIFNKTLPRGLLGKTLPFKLYRKLGAYFFENIASDAAVTNCINNFFENSTRFSENDCQFAWPLFFINTIFDLTVIIALVFTGGFLLSFAFSFILFP